MTAADDESPLIASLRRAVAAAPEDMPLRLHLAEQLAGAGRATDAVAECAVVLAREPANAAARNLMVRALDDGFDWESAEAQLRSRTFVEDGGRGAADDPPAGAWDAVTSDVTLADVAGMERVKERLHLALLAPMRSPELRRTYGKSLRAGLLLYGPPGCGKTFVARAVAGELGARFLAVGSADVLDPRAGSSEGTVREVFRRARREAPCVVFLDDVDALGRRRSPTRSGAARGAVSRLLAELDGVDAAGEGVFVLAATSHPWDVDPALRRPGRLDRTLLVLPPDAAAREAVLADHLAERPVAAIDLRRLARRTDGYSGADLARVCEVAAERALTDAVRTGTPRPIELGDLEAAIDDVGPSLEPWFEVARNAVLLGADDTGYADLRTYLRRTKRL